MIVRSALSVKDYGKASCVRGTHCNANRRFNSTAQVAKSYQTSLFCLSPGVNSVVMVDNAERGLQTQSQVKKYSSYPTWSTPSFIEASSNFEQTSRSEFNLAEGNPARTVRCFSNTISFYSMYFSWLQFSCTCRLSSSFSCYITSVNRRYSYFVQHTDVYIHCPPSRMHSLQLLKCLYGTKTSVYYL